MQNDDGVDQLAETFIANNQKAILVTNGIGLVWCSYSYLTGPTSVTLHCQHCAKPF